MDEKLWKVVPHTDGKYEAHPVGEIRNAKTKRILAGAVYDRSLYVKAFAKYRLYCVFLRGKQKTIYGHHWIALTFIGERPNGMLVLHENDNGLDNRIENLRYGTYADNKIDAARNGREEWRAKTNRESRLRASETNPLNDRRYTKYKYLTREQLSQVIEFHGYGLSQKEIANWFECHYSTISRILGGSRRKLWQE